MAGGYTCTLHVETVVLLSKGEIDSKKVRVEFSLENMDMSGFQKGATHEQIKAHVLEHTGLKVGSFRRACISQSRRMVKFKSFTRSRITWLWTRMAEA